MKDVWLGAQYVDGLRIQTDEPKRPYYPDGCLQMETDLSRRSPLDAIYTLYAVTFLVVTMPRASVLLLDAERVTSDFLVDALELAGYEAMLETEIARVPRVLTTTLVDVLLMCISGDTERGLGNLTTIRSIWSRPILVLGADACPDDEVQALDKGADEWISIPFRLKAFLARLNALLRRATPVGQEDYRILESEAKITSRQREILQYILRVTREHGLPPTISEVQQAFGFKSPNSVRTHIQALQAKDLLMRLPRTARGLVLRNPSQFRASSEIP